MKFGVLLNENNVNLGDDIQAYASSLFLPRVDYMIDRETIDTFEPKDKNEVVATIMSAWWMRRKWNFPPSKYIYPKLISMHLTNFKVRKHASPIFDEFWEGVGGEYMRAYGPVGARDLHTEKVLKELGIDTYFSGCITLTLPKQKIKKPKRDYILLIDLDPRVEAAVREQLKGQDIDIKKIGNNRDERRTPEEAASWEFHKQEAIELLELYQNAKCVVTRRLHVSLPCLAMEVPVFCVFYKTNIRFSPYKDWLNMVGIDEFLAGDYDYDFMNPKPNPTKHLETRKKLTEDLTAWVEETKGLTGTPDELFRPTYTDDEKYAWQYKLMKDTLEQWLPERLAIIDEIKQLRSEMKMGPFGATRDEAVAVWVSQAQVLEGMPDELWEGADNPRDRALRMEDYQYLKDTLNEWLPSSIALVKQLDKLVERKKNPPKRSLYSWARRNAARVLRNLGLRK